MRALRKGQAGIFNLTQDICGEARLVERAFGIGIIQPTTDCGAHSLSVSRELR